MHIFIYWRMMTCQTPAPCILFAIINPSYLFYCKALPIHITRNFVFVLYLCRFLFLFIYFVCACRESVRKDSALVYKQKSQPTNIFVICIISECFLKHDNSVVRSESWYLVIFPKKWETSSHGLVALGFWHIRCIYTVVYVAYVLV